MRKLLIVLFVLLIPSVCWPDSEVTIAGRTGQAHLIQDEGVTLRPRAHLNMTGAVECTDTGGKTVCNFTGGGSGGAGNTFLNWAVPNGTTLVADSTTDTVNFTETGGITITGTAASDTINFNVPADIERVGDCTSGECLVTGGNITVDTVNGNAPHVAVTLAGEDYLSLSTQQITAIAINDDNINFGLGATQVNAADIPIALGGGSPTVDQMQEYLDNTGSSGFFLGGAISDGGSGTVDVAAGSGFIRTTNDDNAQLESFKWSASSTIAVPDDTTQYIYVDDAGAISLSTDEFLETPDKIKIGVVTDEAAAIIHTFNLGVRLQESVAEAGRFIRRVHGISRDSRKGGLIFGQSGDANRDVTMTAGSLWWGRTEYAISAFDTSGADTFATYSAGGSEDAVASQWPNAQFDSAGTLTTMTNNRWANLFFFIEPDDHIIMVYGRAEFTSEALADEEDVPSTSLPSRVSETSLLASRFTFQKSANTATISSAFEELFANASASDHTTLANLAWTSSGHTGTATRLFGTEGAGAAAEYTLSGTGTEIPTTVSPIFTTSVEIPNAANPAIDASGEIAVDSTKGQLVYASDDTVRVLPYVKNNCAAVENLAAADDNMSIGAFGEAVTIISIGCSYVGTGTTVAQISLEDGGGNAMTHNAPVCTAHGTNFTYQPVTAGGGLTSGEILRFDVDNAVSPETDDYTFCYEFTWDRQ